MKDSLIQIHYSYDEIWFLHSIYIAIIIVLIIFIIHLYHKNKKKSDIEQIRNSIHYKLKEIEDEVNSDDLFVRKTVNIIEGHISDPDFDIKSLAGELCMSRSTFTRKIKSISGKTPHNLIKEIKMQYAARLLSKTDITVSDLILKLGYNDHKHFTNSFREFFGITPSEYQKKNRKENNCSC